MKVLVWCTRKVEDNSRSCRYQITLVGAYAHLKTSDSVAALRAIDWLSIRIFSRERNNFWLYVNGDWVKVVRSVLVYLVAPAFEPEYELFLPSV